MKKVTMIAAYNFLNRDGFRIPAKELEPLGQFLVGKPAILDHCHYQVETTWGKVTGWKIDDASTPDWELSLIEQTIFDKEGYRILKLECSAQDEAVANSDVIVPGTHVSVCFQYELMRCPGCQCGENFLSSECPNSWVSVPYLERHKIDDGYEASLVVIPACPVARILEVADD